MKELSRWYKAINPNARPIHIISLLTMTDVIQSPISMVAKITLIIWIAFAEFCKCFRVIFPFNSTYQTRR